jgi:hypothetical protein
MMFVNYRQHAPPTLRLLLILDKRIDYSRHNLGIRCQHKTIPSHACTVGFKVYTKKLCIVEEWNSLKQITIFLQSSQLEKQFKILLKTKHSLPSPFCGTLTLYMWYFWILTKAMMTLPYFCLFLKAYVDFR